MITAGGILILRRIFFGMVMYTGRCIRPAVFETGIDTVTAINGGAALFIQDIVLAEMNTVFAMHLSQMNHLLILCSYDILLRN